MRTATGKPRSLPKSLEDFKKKYPEVHNRYENLGKQITALGPLNARDVHLIKLVLHAAKRQETAFKTHARHAINQGVKPSEIEHAILQLLTIEGLTPVIIGLGWLNDIL